MRAFLLIPLALLLLFVLVAHAQTPVVTALQEWESFDWVSLAIVVGLGSLGGAARSVWTLGDLKAPVRDKLHRFSSDLLTGVIAGCGLYLLIVLWEAHSGKFLPKGVRMPTAVFVGWSRSFLIGWIASIGDVVAAGVLKAARRWADRLGGGGDDEGGANAAG